ncbi:hypothetical protein F5Y16DRAFT_387097 [Xylariaceae sp. FL0255]|nr:hypothetical protein F5Y16DRAFT_387097 [Xylariaceae sp. FL0255]
MSYIMSEVMQPDEETTPLISGGHPEPPCSPKSRLNISKFTRSPASALPLAFLSALALAFTAAAQIFVYADLLCSDPRHCQDAERRKFAASVAIATFVANCCALLSLGGFEILSRRRTRAGLAIWLVVRSMSVVALALGVITQRIDIVMSGQIFEGLASDNVLHFSLNIVYSREGYGGKRTKLIGSSLALYMIGISISPSLASLLRNFRDSFFIACGIFMSALIYLVLVVKTEPILSNVTRRDTNSAIQNETGRTKFLNFVTKSIYSPFAPFVFMKTRQLVVGGLVLFTYNLAQAYTFSAVLVFTSTEFGFTSRENGFLLTEVHLTASLYLFYVLFAAPRLGRAAKGYHLVSSDPPREGRVESTAVLAFSSLTMQGLALVCFGFVQYIWQVYAVSALLAIGLSCPSFVKSYFTMSLNTSERSKALASLAVMETSGSVLAPVVLGGLQVLWPGNMAFFAAAGLAFLAGAMMFSVILADLWGSNVPVDTASSVQQSGLTEEEH